MLIQINERQSCLNNYWVSIIKNGGGLTDHGTLKSGVSHKWFDELKKLIEWILHVHSDGIICGLTTNLKAGDHCSCI